jgi:hypothetical protein
MLKLKIKLLPTINTELYNVIKLALKNSKNIDIISCWITV